MVIVGRAVVGVTREVVAAGRVVLPDGVVSTALDAIFCNINNYRGKIKKMLCTKHNLFEVTKPVHHPLVGFELVTYGQVVVVVGRVVVIVGRVVVGVTLEVVAAGRVVLADGVVSTASNAIWSVRWAMICIATGR